MLVTVLLLSFIINDVISLCPGYYDGTPLNDNASIPTLNEYINELQTLNIIDVFEDIYDLLTDSQECWPSDIIGDESNYGGLFIRLAWHCAGTFRNTDGKGGCAGGRQRFTPESTWDDNTNLDHARALLAPIKAKYGNALSWGDLFIFAGTASISYMGGPITKVCGGRIDDFDGSKSLALNSLEDCGIQGNCSEPIGSSTVGLIYVNPEGVNGEAIPSKSAKRIRKIFGRMGMNDSETVALIGGGHAFGKSHLFTSGFDGQWTDKPFKWDNEYFKQLINDEYILTLSNKNKSQWININNGYLMLTTDLALRDDNIYLSIVNDFANNINSLNIAFSNAWQKLTNAGNGWVNTKYKICVDGNQLTRINSNITTTNIINLGNASQYFIPNLFIIFVIILQFIS